jgi:hypothetical protein
MMTEAASTSEMSVNFYQSTRRNIPEDSHLQYLLLFLQTPRIRVVLWFCSSRLRRRQEESRKVAVEHRTFLEGHFATWRRPQHRSIEHEIAHTASSS